MLHHVANFCLFFQSLVQSGKMTDAAHVDGRRANIVVFFLTFLAAPTEERQRTLTAGPILDQTQEHKRKANVF